MSQFGFDVVLIQKQDADREYYDTAWTLSIIRGLVTALIMFLGAGYAADFFGDQRLVNIIYVLCFVASTSNLANIGIIDFRKDMHFGKDFQYLVGVKLCSFTITLVLAFTLRTYWALVIGVASSTVAQVVLSYFMHPFRPRLGLSRWREIMNFSKWLVVNNMLVYVNERADSLIVGKLLGAATLGLYTVAYEIATMATSELVAPIRRALLPGYAKLAKDSEALKRSFIDGFALIMMVTGPVAVGMGLVADPMVRLFLGDKWHDAIPMLQALAMFGLLQVLPGNIGPVFLAKGMPRLVMTVTAVSSVLGVPLTIIATIYWGVTGTIFALITVVFSVTVILLALIIRVLSLSPAELVSAVWRSVASLLMMAFVVSLVSTGYTQAGYAQSLPLILASEVIAGALTYVATHLGLWRLCGSPHGSERLAVEAISAKLGRKPKLSVT